MNFRAIKSWQWVLIVMALLVALDWAIRRPDARTRELNHILETQASQKLKDYPYQFQVLRVEGTTAVMTTPRNVDVRPSACSACSTRRSTSRMPTTRPSLPSRTSSGGCRMRPRTSFSLSRASSRCVGNSTNSGSGARVSRCRIAERQLLGMSPASF